MLSYNSSADGQAQSRFTFTGKWETIEKNVYWVSRAQAVAFDATRVNNLPVLDQASGMLEQVQAFLPDARAASPPPRVVRAVRSDVIPGGMVQAHPTDAEGLVGMSVDVPRNFWSRADLAGYSDTSFPCVLAAECVREFRHPDGSRSRTYLVQRTILSTYFPIKRDSLIRTCLTSSQRASLCIAW